VRPALRHRFIAVKNRHSEAGKINLFKKLQRGRKQPERKIVHGFQSLQHGNIFMNFERINEIF
jgi:hypothetical protein